MTIHRSRIHMIYTIAVIGFIFTIHTVIPMYSNSSFLSLFVNEKTLSLIYMAGSAMSVFGFLFISSIIKRLGNYTTSIILACIQIGLFYGLIVSDNPQILAIVFILQTAVTSLISLCLDIFLEVYTDGNSVGKIRGLYTATLNASWVIAPFIGSLLINGTNSYRSTYIASLAMLFPLIYLIHRNFPKFVDPNYIHLSPWQLIKHISSNQNWIYLFISNTILQIFYSWMVVYSPIYLNKNIGFSWQEIGIILVIMLIPFPLIQYPLGKIADSKYGEKEIMAIGLSIMGIATMALSLSTEKNILLWSLLFFITRIGAAATEIMIETYFFKTVSARDSAVLGLFRLTRPISYFFAPLIMMIGLYFLNFQYMFVVIGIISLLAIYPALLIKDTK